MFRREVLQNRIKSISVAFDNIRDCYISKYDNGIFDKEEYDSIVLPRYRKSEELILAITEQIKNLTPEVGEGATEHFYTDSEPWEVIEVVSDKTLVLRKMDAVLNQNWKPESLIGGYTVNNLSQEWIITSNEKNPTIRIRKHKNDQWKSKSNTYFTFGRACKFYDYNF